MADGEPRRYVTGDDPNRFAPDDSGFPPLLLIRYQEGLRLSEVGTGLLVGTTDRRLFGLGIYSYNCVGEYYRQTACKDGDFSPGARVRLVREPDNPHDPNAIAVTSDGPGASVAAYISRGHAKRLRKILDAGTQIDAIATAGTAAGQPCDSIAVLAARPELLAYLVREV